MNWWYPLPWDIQGHLALLISGLFWAAIWYVLYIAFVGVRGVARFLTTKSSERSQSGEGSADDAHDTTPTA